MLKPVERPVLPVRKVLLGPKAQPVPLVLREHKARRVHKALLVRLALRVLRGPLDLPVPQAPKGLAELLAKAPIRSGSAWVTPARKRNSSLRSPVRKVPLVPQVPKVLPVP